MLKPRLGHQVLQGLVTVGRYDGHWDENFDQLGSWDRLWASDLELWMMYFPTWMSVGS